MRTEPVSTHALLPGDQVMSHGARFEVTSVAWYSDALDKGGAARTTEGSV